MTAKVRLRSTGLGIALGGPIAVEFATMTSTRSCSLEVGLE